MRQLSGYQWLTNAEKNDMIVNQEYVETRRVTDHARPTDQTVAARTRLVLRCACRSIGRCGHQASALEIRAGQGPALAPRVDLACQCAWCQGEPTRCTARDPRRIHWVSASGLAAQA